MKEEEGSGNDSSSDRFVFVDKDSTDFSFFRVEKSVLPWKQSEPNTKGEECVEWVPCDTCADEYRTWNDRDCDKELAYICRRPCSTDGPTSAPTMKPTVAPTAVPSLSPFVTELPTGDPLGDPYTQKFEDVGGKTGMILSLFTILSLLLIAGIAALIYENRSRKRIYDSLKSQTTSI